MTDPVIVDSVTKIANSIYKKRGYFTRVQEEDVEIIIEAITLLNEAWEQERADRKFAHDCEKVVRKKKCSSKA